MPTQFQKKFSFDKRRLEANRIIEKFPDKIPIIVEQGKSDKLPKIDKSKFLVPQDITVGQFMTIIRKRIKLSESDAFFLFVKNSVLPSNSTTMVNIYEAHKDEDGFLYMTYCGENVFG
tara:strand:+ start:550 stop:903 length:354 start_codon:yes stop_codon:yes gene_type:complete